MKAINVEGLVRKFGDFVAVDKVTFTVNKDEIFGFLGPNGAGKTTAINMLCKLLRPDAGSAKVNGYDVVNEQAAVRQSIDLTFQDPSLNEQLTGRENLCFHAIMYDLSRELFQEHVDDLLAIVDLSDKADDLVRTYSGGDDDLSGDLDRGQAEDDGRLPHDHEFHHVADVLPLRRIFPIERRPTVDGVALQGQPCNLRIGPAATGGSTGGRTSTIYGHVAAASDRHGPHK